MSIWSRLLGYLRKEAVTKRAGGVTKRPAGTGRAAMFEGLEGRAMLSATMPPADPSSLVAADSSSTAIKLTWHDNSVRETGYKIERSTDDKTFSQINSVSANTTSYTSGGLTTGKKYYYRVRAYNSGGNSKYTNIASATPAASAPAPEATTVKAATSSSSSGAPSWANGGTGAYATGKWYFDGMSLSVHDPSQVSKAIPVLKSLHIGTVRLWWGMTTWGNRAGNWSVQAATQLHNAGFKVIMNVGTSAVPTYAQAAAFYTYIKNKPGALKAVDYWEIDNEPNQIGFWKGTPSQYVNQVLKPAWDVLHPAGAKILGAGPTWDANFAKILVADGYNNYCDYAGFHPYGPGPQDVYARALAAKAAYQGKPMIFTEWNVRNANGNYTLWASEIDQARKLIAPLATIALYFPFTVGTTLAGKGGVVNTSFSVRNPFFDAVQSWGE